jgi:hypothetical protein
VVAKPQAQTMISSPSCHPKYFFRAAIITRLAELPEFTITEYLNPNFWRKLMLKLIDFFSRRKPLSFKNRMNEFSCFSNHPNKVQNNMLLVYLLPNFICNEWKDISSISFADSIKVSISWYIIL